MIEPHGSLAQLLLYFLKLGTLGFGGPVALVGYMHRDLVERRGWISIRTIRTVPMMSLVRRQQSGYTDEIKY